MQRTAATHHQGPADYGLPFTKLCSETVFVGLLDWTRVVGTDRVGNLIIAHGDAKNARLAAHIAKQLEESFARCVHGLVRLARKQDVPRELLGEGDDSASPLTLPWTPPSPYLRREIIQGASDATTGARPMRANARATTLVAAHLPPWLARDALRVTRAVFGLLEKELDGSETEKIIATLPHPLRALWPAPKSRETPPL